MDDDDDAAFLELVNAMDKEDGAALQPSISEASTSATDKISDMEKRIRDLEAQLASEKKRQHVPLSLPVTPPETSSFKTTSEEKRKPGLVDLDYNIFTTKNARVNPSLENFSASNSQPSKTVSLADLGLSESSDDDEDYGATNLSKSGRKIKRQLEIRADEEITTKRSSWSQPSPERPKKTVFAELSAPAPSSQNSQRAAIHSAPTVVEKCPFSGYKIRNPAITQMELGCRIGDKRTCTLSLVPIQYSSFGRSDWVTFGVLVTKLPTKVSAKGNQFSIWKIADLDDVTNLVSLFLFDGAHSECWKIQAGNAVAVLNANIMPKRDDKSGLALSIGTANQLIEIGYADDLSYCKGQAKDGAACKNFINKSKSEYCVYHLKAAFQKVSSQRMDLQMNWSGVQPKKGSASKMAEIADGYFYGGKMFAAPSAVAEVRKLPPKPLRAPITKEAQSLIDESRELIRKQLNENEKRTLAKVMTENEELNRFMVNDGPGTRNLVRMIAKEDSRKQPAKFISPSEMLKNHEQSMKALMAQHKQRAAAKTNFIPKLGRASTGGDVVVMDSVEKRASVGSPPAIPMRSVSNDSGYSSPKSPSITPSQARAIAQLKQSGKTIVKSDPNRSSANSAVAREHILQVVTDTSQSVKLVDCNTPRQMMFNLKDDVDIQALLGENSKHDDLCKLGEMEYMDKYFHNAEQLESMEEQMEKVKEMECNVVTCKMCKYTATSLSQRCMKEKHPFVRHKEKKQFFQCKKCNKRKQSFASLLVAVSPCKGCGNENFQRCGMLPYERKGPKLDSEILLIRGEEQAKFLNSAS